MTREDVYKAIDTERAYQDRETENPERIDMVEDFNLGQAILAIEEILSDARYKWYNDTPKKNYSLTMPLLRKVAGVCVMMGEKYGMEDRK